MRILFLVLLTLNLYSSTLHLATSSNPARLNPILATDSSSSDISQHIFNGLLKYDKDSQTIIGDLAKKFYFENDQTLVFELKEGVKWHDGAGFSSEDVLFTYKVLTSNKISSPYSAGFRFVKDVEIVNKYKLKVHYKQPYFKAAETWMMGIIPKHILKDEKN
ncbi:MAG: ABC transporter substrate-binding protein, partial [Thiovulaceae bacterium]|nr:ABC transporter substrate-binding protein [Sulfurimonadaceae bacterium]